MILESTGRPTSTSKKIGALINRSCSMFLIQPSFHSTVKIPVCDICYLTEKKMQAPNKVP